MKKIKIVSLINGMDIIGEETSRTDTSIGLDKCHQILMQVHPQTNQAGIQFVPWIPYGVEAGRILNLNVIISIMDPLPQLDEQFRKLTSPILQPSGLIIPQ